MPDIVYNLPEFDSRMPRVVEFKLIENFDPDNYYIEIKPLESMENDERYYKYEKVTYLYQLADWIHTLGYKTWVNFKMRKI